MAYKALYRTYRPSTFDEVAGQEHIVKTLKNALATGKIAHAYLFAGPRGTGKTTMAKLLAKALNCDQGVGEQCNECKNCLSINSGNHPDVIEIDAASNNGVDNIRDLIDKVKYSTTLGKYKVYIIDEVHMLSPGAFNALLKTLEEPPSHVIFILATTEPHKILPTILSRCQRYDFSKLSNKEITERLRVVLEAEGIEFNEEAVELIVNLSDGGMRDALSILDQVLAYSGDTLNTQDVLDIFSLESLEEKVLLVDSIVNGDVNDVLKRLSRYITKGTDIKRLTNDLLVIFKDILIYSNTKSEKLLEQLDEDDASIFARKIRRTTLIEMIDILMNAMKDYKFVTSINPLFEISLLKLVNLFKISEPIDVSPEVKKIVIKPETHDEEIIEETSFEPVKEVVTPKVEETKVEEDTSSATQGSLFDQTPDPVVLNKNVLILKKATGQDMFEIDDDTIIDIMVVSKKDIKNKMLASWVNLKKYISHPELGKAAAILSDCHPLVTSQKVLIIECALQTVAEKANNKKIQEKLQNVIQSVFGIKVFVYAVSRKESVRLQRRYVDLLQLSKLPKADTITLEFLGE